MESDLVASAATTLVERLTGEAWQTVVAAIGGLWRRVHAEQGDAVEADAAETRAAALRALEIADDEAVAELVGEWRSRLRRLVAGNPAVADELRRMVEGWASASGGGDTDIGSISMRVRASGHSSVTMAGRDVHITGP
ncbi:hypothetical protein ALI22I_44395 [Saccharothrix sp. ALI-22-I]|uniref:hypothetical protein n=1 Tax=Saccharothrix sp. ALI-22-I TaxID=1933778 RepID=UPI00097CA3A9|nr:hypothetical protein [Saccharothrix sp. ALI-22-I]ONI80376.1 hypothetical protein ALI22I_44395 [Saccharothrix sp. ALI-22-I]